MTQQQAIHKFVLGSKELEGKVAEFQYDRGWYSITNIVGEEREEIYRSKNAQEAYTKWNVYIGRKKERTIPEEHRKPESEGSERTNERSAKSERNNRDQRGDNRSDRNRRDNRSDRKNRGEKRSQESPENREGRRDRRRNRSDRSRRDREREE